MQDSELPRISPRPAAALGLGERLRSARKARALSVEQVADALRLDESLVRALEDEKFDRLGAPVFVRGHLRRYAQLVGLATEAVLDAYRATAPDSAEPPALTRHREPEMVRVGPWAIWVAGAAVLIALVLFLTRSDDSGSAPAGAPVAAPAPAPQSAPTPQAVPVPLPAPVTPPNPVPAPTPDATLPSGPEAAPLVAPGEPAAAAAVPVEPVELELQFGEDSWVNVADVERRLLYGLQRAGSRQQLTGRPPFRLMLGNARSTRVMVNGNRFVVPPEQVSENVARFDIPALPPVPQ